MTSSGRISLAMLPRALRDRFGEAITYNRLYLRALDGRIPAEQVGGKWFVRTSDLDAIAATLDLRKQTVTK